MTEKFGWPRKRVDETLEQLLPDDHRHFASVDERKRLDAEQNTGNPILDLSCNREDPPSLDFND